MSASTDTISSVAAHTIRLPLPRPLELGAQVVREREYVAVQLRTTDGIDGVAFALSRETAVAATISKLLAPLLVGSAADNISATVDRLVRATGFGGRVGTVMRAISLIDVALWDIKGKRAGLPVWRLLGGAAPEVPCVLVAGYPTGEPPEAIGERVGQAGRDGHQILKVARPPDPDALSRLLGAAAAVMGDRSQVIVDVAYAWRTAHEAASEMSRWLDKAPMAWVEDPFVPEDVESYRRLTRKALAPIGAGDELTDRFTVPRLLDAGGIDVLRIDALAIGGLTTAAQLTNVAQAIGVPVSYHVYPETHVHLAAGGVATSWTETFGPRDNPFDPGSALYFGGPTFTPGTAVASEEPGLGIVLDTDRIERGATDSWRST